MCLHTVAGEGGISAEAAELRKQSIETSSQLVLRPKHCKAQYVSLQCIFTAAGEGGRAGISTEAGGC